MKKIIERLQRLFAARVNAGSGIKIGGHFAAFFYDVGGNLREVVPIKNLVPAAACNDVLDVYLGGGTQKTQWWIAPKGSGAVADSDTMASHPGWAEITAYSETTRQLFVPGAAVNKSIDNDGDEPTFTANEDGVEISGSFLCSGSTKGGTADLLFAAGDFPDGTRTLNTGESVKIKYTCQSQDSGS